MSEDKSIGSPLSAMFLVAGTCIGGGMLAFPVTTGTIGFFPSLVMMLLCWVAMTSSALLLLEVSLWLEDGVHMITMSKRMLGRGGEVISWIMYLFVAYASIVAYTAVGGIQISAVFAGITGLSLSKGWSCLLFILIFGLIVDFGAKVVGRINSILFTGMIVAYFCLIYSGFDEVSLTNLLYQNWHYSYMTIPLLLTAFSFQTMVPSLTHYLKRNPVSLRLAVVGGTTIALAIYVIWQWFVLGIVPVDGESGLRVALERGEPATYFIREASSSKWIGIVAEYFAFFALVTSFLGMTLGLFDFLADGLHIEKKGKGKLLLALLIVVPTFFSAVYIERIFLLALDASGGFGDTILNGILPVCMVWMGRYHYKYPNKFRLPGGRFTLLLLLGFYVFSLLIEVGIHLGLAPSIYDVQAEL